MISATEIISSFRKAPLTGGINTALKKLDLDSIVSWAQTIA
jgi:hypothetical protein